MGSLCIEMDVKWPVLSRFGVIMFFWRLRAQTEGRRYAHLRSKVIAARGTPGQATLHSETRQTRDTDGRGDKGWCGDF